MNIHTEWKKWKNLGENRAFFTHFFYSQWKLPVPEKFTYIYIHWAVCPRLSINTFFLLSSPSVHSLNVATDARCIASNVTPGQSACVKLIDEVFHLLVGEVTQLSIEIVICAVMVCSSEPQVIEVVNIPSTIIALRVIETVRDVTGFQQFVPNTSAIPETKVCDADNRMGQLNVEVSLLVIQIAIVHFATQFVLLVRVSYFGILFLQKVRPVFYVNVGVRPDNVFHSVNLLSTPCRFFPVEYDHKLSVRRSHCRTAYH